MGLSVALLAGCASANYTFQSRPSRRDDKRRLCCVLRALLLLCKRCSVCATVPKRPFFTEAELSPPARLLFPDKHVDVDDTSQRSQQSHSSLSSKVLCDHLSGHHVYHLETAWSPRFCYPRSPFDTPFCDHYLGCSGCGWLLFGKRAHLCPGALCFGLQDPDFSHPLSVELT